jgi:acetoin utilization protein AcuB
MVMKVKELMTADPITIDPDAPLGTAMAVMRDKTVRHLPVVDEAGRLLGIVTDRDLRSAAFAPALAEHLSLGARRRLHGVSQALEEIRVRDAMTWNVVTTHPEATIAHAAAAMFQGRFGCLPVVQDDRLVGMLTERDLLRALGSGTSQINIDIEGFPW